MQVFRAEMVRLAACLGDSGAVEALIRLGLGREDRVLVFRCDFATPSTPPVRMVSFQGAPNSLNRSELRVRAAIQPSLSPNFAQFRSRPRGPNLEKHFAKLFHRPTYKSACLPCEVWLEAGDLVSLS